MAAMAAIAAGTLTMKDGTSSRFCCGENLVVLARKSRSRTASLHLRSPNVRRFSSFSSRRGDFLGGEQNEYRMNLNEYMVTLSRPLGIRFAQLLNGVVFVDALVREGYADSSRLIMVGDVLKKVVLGDGALEDEDFTQIMTAIKTSTGPVTLVLERSFFSTRIQSLILESKLKTSFNHGRVGTVAWKMASLTGAEPQNSTGIAMYAWKSLVPEKLEKLTTIARTSNGTSVEDRTPTEEDVSIRGNMFQIIATYTEEENSDALEWTRGDFSLVEFKAAQSRAARDLTYNHEFGLQYTKLTSHIYAGSCWANGEDIQHLKSLGITAVLNLQSESEQINWEIDKNAIRNLAYEENISIANCPIRDVDTVDLRRKLPLAVAVLYRMLRLGHHVYVMCSNGLDRSPACVVGYMHWIQDVPLQNALDTVTKQHPCGPDRPALAWATWDLIAIAQKESYDGPPTHAVQLVWNHGCKEGEEVLLVGDFRGGWREPIKALHIGGPKYAVDLRLRQGKYQYKFIVGGQWRHSTSLPTETDRWGNLNNVIVVGRRASVRFDSPIHASVKDLATVRVIERPLTDEERLMLAFAARRMAFAVCPLRLKPKFEL